MTPDLAGAADAAVAAAAAGGDFSPFEDSGLHASGVSEPRSKRVSGSFRARSARGETFFVMKRENLSDMRLGPFFALSIASLRKETQIAQQGQGGLTE